MHKREGNYQLFSVIHRNKLEVKSFEKTTLNVLFFGVQFLLNFSFIVHSFFPLELYISPFSCFEYIRTTVRIIIQNLVSSYLQCNSPVGIFTILRLSLSCPWWSPSVPLNGLHFYLNISVTRGLRCLQLIVLAGSPHPCDYSTYIVESWIYCRLNTDCCESSSH